MAVVFIAEFADIRGNAAYMPPLVEQTVAITAGSVQSAAFGATTRFIRVHTDGVASIAIGANPTATITTGRIAANSTEYFAVRQGASDKIAVILNT
jgi:hypothetical protein